MAAFITTCNEDSVHCLKRRLNHIYQVIEIYRWIIEAYVSDFYVKNHWARLPVSWQQYLEQLEFDHLSNLLTGKPWCQPTLHSSVTPLSLLAMKTCCLYLSVSRHYVDLENANLMAMLAQNLQDGNSELVSETKHCTSVHCDEISMGKSLAFKNGQLMEMEHIFRKHVKPKKQHEIQQLGKVIQLVSEVARCYHVVDVGAGLGHLSRLLTFAYGLKVTTVEATDGHAPKACEFDRELNKDIQKRLKKSSLSTQEKTTIPDSDFPFHVISTVQPDIKTEEFLNLVLKKTSRSEGAHRENKVHVCKINQVCPSIKPTVKAEASAEVKSVTCVGKTRTSDPRIVNLSFGEQESKMDSSAGSVMEESDATFAETRVSLQLDATEILNLEYGEQESMNVLLETISSNSAIISDMTMKLSESERGESVRQNQDCCKQPRLQSTQQLIQDQSCCKNHVEMKSHELRCCDKPMINVQHQNCCNTTSKSMKPESSEISVHHSLCNCGKDLTTCGNKNVNSFVLVGLHACGDLTSTLLRVFARCPAMSALVSVTCCYMKLSTASDEDTQSEKGYPMSQFVRHLQFHPLTYEAREMACHFADAYAKRLLDQSPHLRIHSFRAALQYVVTHTRPDFPHGATRLVMKKGAEVPFTQYAGQCLQRLGIDPLEVSDDVMTTAENLTQEWRKVVAFYTLRLSLAPLVETAVLLDRMLFLHEHGQASILLPIFESTLSPRNFVLLACRAHASCQP